nr:hypothetical protein [Tanacetum cinerariifolium]
GVVGSVEDGLFILGGVSCYLELSVEEEDPTLVVMELLHLLKEKHFIDGGRGQSCHSLTLFVFEERGLECYYQ